MKMIDKRCWQIRSLVCLLAAALAGASMEAAQPQPGGATRSSQPAMKTYGQGTKVIEVDAGQVTGKIHSLLGVNRGPISFPRREGERVISHVENFKQFGVDIIRTHDFYGPTDWWMLFPDWKADPALERSYDFATSDERIRNIVENGFQCFYRLGTSWRGRQLKPINDPPGTVRDGSGRVTHVAEREDFRKWATINVQTLRHYREGWNGGFKYPIEYWEIWNEPDLREQFWTGTPEQFYVLFEETAKALKTAFPKIKVGGPGCTGAFREPYVEGLIEYCRRHQVPLDFYSWHSYGRPGEFNPYNYYKAARVIREALDKNGFKETENIITEWNAGIRDFLFSDVSAGAAYYASTLGMLLDAGVSRAFQYCGDVHPGLGMHELQTGNAKISAWAFAAWKQMLKTPDRLVTRGSDERGYYVVAGKDATGQRVSLLISDFQSAHDKFQVKLSNLPWSNDTSFKVKRQLLDQGHKLSIVEETFGKGRSFTMERPFGCAAVCVIELERE